MSFIFRPAFKYLSQNIEKVYIFPIRVGRLNEKYINFLKSVIIWWVFLLLLFLLVVHLLSLVIAFRINCIFREYSQYIVEFFIFLLYILAFSNIYRYIYFFFALNSPSTELLKISEISSDLKNKSRLSSLIQYYVKSMNKFSKFGYIWVLSVWHKIATISNEQGWQYLL